MGSRVQLFEQIRRESRVEGLSVRALAKRHHVHRRTVRQALASAMPPEPAPRVWQSRKIDPYAAAIDGMLAADVEAPRKQRHTARRILARLADEHGAQELSYSTVRDYVRVRRAQIDIEAGRRIEVFVPQEHAPGAEAEVDFGEVWVILAGVKTKCHMFTFRLSYSGKAVHRVYSTRGQETFFEGHIAAFEEISGAGDPSHPVRQFDQRSAESDLRVFPRTGGEPALGAVPFAFRFRPVLRPTRHIRSTRKGRRGGRGRQIPPKQIVPDACCRLPR
ncbi:hypothetical protein ABH922_005292 [Rhodococcus sp. 27YEA15]